MFVDGRTLHADAHLEADVCIIGAGPAGIALTLQLIPTHARVLIIESGGVSPEVRAKHLDRGHSVGYPYYNLMFTRARAFGGTTSRWHLRNRRDPGWIARPLDPIDFQARPGIPRTAWPFDAAHMDPYYRRAHAMSDLEKDSYDVTDWETAEMQRLPLPEQRVETQIVQLGMTAFTRFREEFATESRVTVLYHSTVTEIRSSGEPAVVHGIRAATSPGRHFTIDARFLVLAAGGIENPRLLLASRSHHPQGLGNGRDLVGRFFMEHPSGRVGLVRPSRPDVVRRAGLYDSHREGNVLVQGVLTLSPDVVRREGLRRAGFFLLPRTEAFAAEGVRSTKALFVSSYRRPRAPSVRGHVRNITADLPSIARTVVSSAVGSAPPPSLLVVRAQAEQTPDPTSRVTLGTDRDAYGIPRVVLDWRLSDDDVASIRRSEDLIDEELRRAGLGRIERKLGEESPPLVIEGHHHHMGTTRMDVDPQHGVVDSDGLVHGTRNLYATGTSVFPSGGYINPTLTVVALGIRLGDHLRARLEGKA
jgi:choline dehydrogenase-like flavoprotein